MLMNMLAYGKFIHISKITFILSACQACQHLLGLVTACHGLCTS
jgi:hypothetical protein